MTKRRVVVDSSAWIEYFRGTPQGAKTRDAIEGAECGTPVVVLAELSDKYHRMGWPSRERDLEFVLSRSAILELTQDIALRAGGDEGPAAEKTPGLRPGRCHHLRDRAERRGGTPHDGLPL